MGRRGPAPTPTAVKMRLGETRPSRINAREPVPRQVTPRMPSDLAPDARVVWHRVLREMPIGVITGADQDVLRCYCEAVARYIQGQRILVQSSPLVTRRGDLVKNPMFQIVRDTAEQVRLFARELGLSPAARAGLQIDLTGAPTTVLDEIGPAPRFRVVNGGDVD